MNRRCMSDARARGSGAWGGAIRWLALLFVLLLLQPVPARAEPLLGVVIAGVDGEFRSNVLAHLGQPPSLEPAVLARFMRAAPARVEAALQALGHYHAELQLTLDERPDPPVLTLVIAPGEPTRLRHVDVRVSGAGSRDPLLRDLIERLSPLPGAVLNHGDYQRLLRALQTTALQRGYFDGRFETRQIRVARQDFQADLLVDYASGERYGFGSVVFSELPLHPRLLSGLQPFAPGDPYDAVLVTQLNRNLLQSGYFSSVRVSAQTTAADPISGVPVRADLELRPANTIRAGLGYSTDVGPRARLTWQRPWVTMAGHTFETDAEIAQRRQSLELRYGIPLDPPLQRRVELSAGAEGRRQDDTDATRLTLGARWQWLLAEEWEASLFARLERERFTQADVDGQTMLLLPGASLGRVRSRGSPDPEWGDRQFLSVEGARSELGSDLNLLRVRASTAWVRSVGRHRLHLRGEVGLMETARIDALPPSLRYFAGGDRSVRGYAYRSLGPRNAEGALIGGRYLLTGSAEYDYPVREHWRVAVFHDVGNAMDSWDESLKRGAGLGVRRATPLGPVRLDLAWALDAPRRPFRVHLSVGLNL
jgi:translocation and assembly module TamA